MATESEADQDLPRYVMVPVPREFVLDVMRWVLFRSPDESADNEIRDHVRLTEFVAGVNEFDRQLLLFLAQRAVLGAEPLLLSDVAADLNRSPDSVTLSVGEINHRAGRDIIEVASETSIGARNKIAKLPYLSMRLDHARIVREAFGRDDAGESQATENDEATAPS